MRGCVVVCWNRRYVSSWVHPSSFWIKPCVFQIASQPHRKKKRVTATDIWLDEMFRALSALFWCGARAVRVAMEQRVLFSRVLQCAVRAYADRTAHATCRNSAGLCLQNLCLAGPESRLLLEMALEVEPAGALPSAIVYWMWPTHTSAKKTTSDASQRRDTTLQAAQLACNFCQIRAAPFAQAGLLTQTLHVLVQLYDDPTVLAVLVNVLLVLLTQMPQLARMVAGTMASSPTVAGKDAISPKRSETKEPCCETKEPCSEIKEPPVVFLECPVPPARLRRISPTLSRRPLLWLLALAQFQQQRALADSTMRVLALIMRTCGQELHDQELDVAHSQASEQERSSGYQWTTWLLKPELGDQVQRLARACGWIAESACETVYATASSQNNSRERVADTPLATYFQAYLPPERCARSECGKTSAAVRLRMCSRCKRVRYCSSECQKQHWPLHKSACMSLLGATDVHVASTTQQI